MLRRFHPLLPLLILVAFVTSLGVLAQRHRIEWRNRRVGLVLDYAQVRSLAAAAGIPPFHALRQFQAAGASGAAVAESTLGDLQAQGELTVAVTGVGPRRVYRLLFGDPAAGARVFEHLNRIAPGSGRMDLPGEHVSLSLEDGRALSVPGRFEDFRAFPVGIDRQALAMVRAAALDPVGRIGNPPALSRENLSWALTRLKDAGVQTVIFSGEEVLGFRGLIPDTVETLRSLGLRYGSVEFGKQRGDERLSAEYLDGLVRVHSISSAEITRMTPGEAIERYVRAAEERNIRLLFVRLPSGVTAATYSDALEYVRHLMQDLERSGFALGRPQPFPAVPPEGLGRRAVQALNGAGIGAALVLLLAALVPIRRAGQAGLGAIVATLGSLVGLSGLSLAQQVLALSAAIVFPTLAMVLFPQPVGAFENHQHLRLRDREEAIVPAIAEFGVMTLITLVGAALVAATLSELPFMLKVRAFAGVKAATVLPILLVGWIYGTGMIGLYPSWRMEREAITSRIRGLVTEPVRIWHAVALVAVVVLLALLVARSGNDAGVGVSALELRFRSLLDRVLFVRPRTKEFLIGHPALLLGLVLTALPYRRKWALPLLLVGMVGQTGMLNSFCHLHTPIFVTVIRSANGLWTGAVLGVLAALLWLRLDRPRHIAPQTL